MRNSRCSPIPRSRLSVFGDTGIPSRNSVGSAPRSPRRIGGAGGDLVDLAALAAGVGRGGLPLPIAMTCGAIPHLLADHHDLLTALAEGRHRMAFIAADAAVDDDVDAPHLSGALLTGAVVGIATPPDPTHVLVVLDRRRGVAVAGAGGRARRLAHTLPTDRRSAIGRLALCRDYRRRWPDPRSRRVGNATRCRGA